MASLSIGILTLVLWWSLIEIAERLKEIRDELKRIRIETQEKEGK
jgi:hypothetical protein